MASFTPWVEVPGGGIVSLAVTPVVWLGPATSGVGYLSPSGLQPSIWLFGVGETDQQIYFNMMDVGENWTGWKLYNAGATTDRSVALASPTIGTCLNVYAKGITNDAVFRGQLCLPANPSQPGLSALGSLTETPFGSLRFPVNNAVSSVGGDPLSAAQGAILVMAQQAGQQNIYQSIDGGLWAPIGLQAQFAPTLMDIAHLFFVGSGVLEGQILQCNGLFVQPETSEPPPPPTVTWSAPVVVAGNGVTDAPIAATTNLAKDVSQTTLFVKGVGNGPIYFNQATGTTPSTLPTNNLPPSSTAVTSTPFTFGGWEPIPNSPTTAVAPAAVWGSVNAGSFTFVFAVRTDGHVLYTKMS